MRFFFGRLKFMLDVFIHLLTTWRCTFLNHGINEFRELNWLKTAANHRHGFYSRLLSTLSKGSNFRLQITKQNNRYTTIFKLETICTKKIPRVDSQADTICTSNSLNLCLINLAAIKFFSLNLHLVLVALRFFCYYITLSQKIGLQIAECVT